MRAVARRWVACALASVLGWGCTLDYDPDQLPHRDGAVDTERAAVDAAAVDVPLGANAADAIDDPASATDTAEAVDAAVDVAADSATDTLAITMDAPLDPPDVLLADARDASAHDAFDAAATDARDDASSHPRDAATTPDARDAASAPDVSVATDAIDVATRCAACPSPGLCCDDGCVDPRIDPTNCGGCGRACGGAPNAVARCSGGTCGIQCAAGWGDCDGVASNGCETDLATDAAHCGSCATACAVAHGTPACRGGACAVAGCDHGFADCDGRADDGCEADLSTAAHCGGCGTACGVLAPACSNGVCCGLGTVGCGTACCLQCCSGRCCL